jgi:putative two-component system response regulator
VRESGERTVLVVDDDPAMLLLCRANLRESKLRVNEAASASEALESVRVDRPDLILLDIMMPGVSGWQVAAQLLGDRATDEIPIVFLTALSGTKQRQRAFELGAVGYVTKPFDPASLGPTLIAVLDQIERGERSALIAENLDALRADMHAS